MADYKTEILTGAIAVVTTLVATISAYHYGGKQKNKNGALSVRNDRYESISRGADTIVETSEKLLKNLYNLIEKEQKKTHDCELRLKKQDEKIELQEQRIEELEKRMKK